MTFDIANMRYAVGMLLKSFNCENYWREGLEETPDRVTKAWQFWLSGYEQDPKAVLKEFKDGGENYDEMIFEGNIPLYSHCEHHLTPFFGVAHVAYIPNKKIVGLSKIIRLVEVYSRRLQVQERLTQQICYSLFTNLGALGVGVVLRCRHLCLESRGVQKPGVITITSSLQGTMKIEESCRAEFLQFVNCANSEMKSI
jgi:GTP cyclohydrolase I